MVISTMRATKNVLLAGMLAAVALGPAASAGSMGDADHKVVIQVSTKDALTQKIALNNAANLQKAYGMDNVDVEIVAYGPGLSMLTRNSQYAERVKSMGMQDVHFSACSNTMAKIKRKKGHEPQLVDGVNVVAGGVKRINELQEAGYSYIRP